MNDNEMDPTLAKIYGTGSDASGDTTKLASAAALENMEEEGQMDISDLSPEQIEELSASVLAANSGDQTEQAEEQAEVTEPDMEKEAEAKFAEADYTGRIIAHSMVNELNKIAAIKTAGPKAEKAKALFGAAKNTAHEVGGKVSKYLRESPDRARAAAYHGKEAIKANPKKAIGAGAAMAAAAGGAAAYKHGKKKTASAFDTLVEGRMGEICEQLQIPAELLQKALSQEPEAEKTAGAEMEQLGSLVEQTAIDQLIALGLVEKQS